MYACRRSMPYPRRRPIDAGRASAGPLAPTRGGLNRKHRRMCLRLCLQRVCLSGVPLIKGKLRRLKGFMRGHFHLAYWALVPWPPKSPPARSRSIRRRNPQKYPGKNSNCLLSCCAVEDPDAPAPPPPRRLAASPTRRRRLMSCPTSVAIRRARRTLQGL